MNVVIMLTIVEALAAAAIVCKALIVLNRMSAASCQTIAAAWVAMGGAAMSQLVELVAVAPPPDWRSVLLLAAVAWMQLVERRRR